MTPPRFLALVDEYLAVRRGLGFDSDTPRWLLMSFVRYADRIGHQGPLTTDLAVQWALASRLPRPGTSHPASVRPSAIRALRRGVRPGHRDPACRALGLPPAP